MAIVIRFLIALFIVNMGSFCTLVWIAISVDSYLQFKRDIELRKKVNLNKE